MFFLTGFQGAQKGPFHLSSCHFKKKTKYDALAAKSLEAQLLSYFSTSQRYLDISLPTLQMKSSLDASAIIQPMLFPSSFNSQPPPPDATKTIPKKENLNSSIMEETSLYCTTTDFQNAARHRPECKDMVRYRLLSSRFTNNIEKGFKEHEYCECSFTTIQQKIENIWENAHATYRSFVMPQNDLSSRTSGEETGFTSSPKWRVGRLPDRVVFIIMHSSCQHTFPVGEPMRTLYERICQLAYETPRAGGDKILRMVPIRIGLKDSELNDIPKYYEPYEKNSETNENNNQNSNTESNQANGPFSGLSYSPGLYFPYGGLYTLHGVLQRLRALPSINIPTKIPTTKLTQKQNLERRFNGGCGTLKRRIIILSDAWLQPRLAAAMHGAAIDPEKDWLERKSHENCVKFACKKAMECKIQKPLGKRLTRYRNDEHTVSVFPAVMSEGLSEKEIDAFARYALVHYILS
ncbi:unnamed protein product [Phytomonas sp. Hart1]|nr:unnamed protein product [Phytomonas sp. Hart1]|eukprot:CCW70163.1 unnamed protein product [Phytomonas sp. isolate Hart1]